MNPRAVSLIALSVLLFCTSPIFVHAVVAGEEGLSQVQTGATKLTDLEKQALACRASADAEALLAVGSATALDRQVLNLGSSAADDWCLYLKTHLENAPSHVEGLNPGFGQCLMKFFQAGDATGAHLTINSGYRTPERQAELFNEAVQKYGSVSAARTFVAPPPCSAGTNAVACSDNGSKHQRGLAADLHFNGQAMPKLAAGLVACEANHACKWAHLNAAAFGLDFRIRNVEVWHIEPSGAGCQNEGQTVPADTPLNPVDTPTTVGDSGSTGQSLIEQMLTTAQQQVEQGMTSGLPGQESGTKDILGNLFSTIAHVFTQPVGSNTAGNNTGATEYLVISEDGTVLAQSNVSAKDALQKVSAFYTAGVTATSSVAHIKSGTGGIFTGTTSNALDVFQLGEGVRLFLSGNTFPHVEEQGNTVSAGTPSGTSGGFGTFVQTFIQTIFGMIGSLLGNIGKGN